MLLSSLGILSFQKRSTRRRKPRVRRRITLEEKEAGLEKPRLQSPRKKEKIRKMEKKTLPMIRREGGERSKSRGRGGRSSE